MDLLRDEDDEDDAVWSRYSMMEKIGQGTYGMVYKALCLKTNTHVAIKKMAIQYEDDGVPATALREIALLKECDHPNIIWLQDVLVSEGLTSSLHLVFECLDCDLRAWLKRTGPMRDPQLLRSCVRQCFSGLDYCHGRRIIHRDLKPQNVLVDLGSRSHGSSPVRLVLGDFGLARLFQVPLKVYTHEVVTLWYRAPEVLLGQRKYGPTMDIWSLGCIMAEMATGHALFAGDSEIDTMFKIFKCLGTPTEEVWPGVETLREYTKNFPKWRDTHLEDLRRCSSATLGEDGLDLVAACLRYDLVERPSAKKALRSAFLEENAQQLSVDKLEQLAPCLISSRSSRSA